MHALLFGFQVAFTLQGLLAGVAGVLLGTVIGVIPALGPTQGAALLIPVIFTMPPHLGLIFLSGLYMGAIYGGSVTAILFNIPGTPMSVASAFDGYPMTLKGQAPAALAASSVCAFAAGIVCVILFFLFAIPLAEFALAWGPPEFFAVLLVAYGAIVGLGGQSLVKSVISVILGLIFTTIGFDSVTGRPRLDFGMIDLMAGVGFLVVVVGAYGLGELLLAAEENIQTKGVVTARVRPRDVLQTLREMRGMIGTLLRSTIIGFWVGVLPGTGATPASFLCYGTAKRFSRHPERFGQGEMEGLIAPQAGASAGEVGSMLPLVTLGIPGSPTAAVVLGALLIWGLHPGPLLMTDHPEVVWGFIASMFLAEVLAAVLNLFCIPFWAKILSVPFTVQLPVIVLLCYIGGYTENNTLFTIGLVYVFGIVGYLFKKLDYPLAPMVIAVVLGSQTEEAFRQSLIMSQGSLTIFFDTWISIVMLALAAMFFFWSPASTAVRWIIRRRLLSQRPSTGTR
jgi:putative tricarboxylic transport membrane protein